MVKVKYGLYKVYRGRCDRDRMVGEFTTTGAIVESSNPTAVKVYSIQHYVIKFVTGYL